MKLSQWAKNNGLCYRTAYNLFKSNKLPVQAYQLETGTIIVKDTVDSSQKPSDVVIYARVSSHDQKEDLNRQIKRLKNYCAYNGMKVSGIYSEIASGLNQNRKKLNYILNTNTIKTIVVENNDRLTRFGFNLIQSTLNAQDRNIIVINDTENKEDLVQDFIDVITSMCAKIYGKRSAKNKAMRAIEATRENTK